MTCSKHAQWKVIKQPILRRMALCLVSISATNAEISSLELKKFGDHPEKSSQYMLAISSSTLICCPDLRVQASFLAEGHKWIPSVYD